MQELANNSILDALNGSELVVYLRLLSLSKDQKSKRVRAINGQLYRDAKTATRALARLEDMGLLKVTHDNKGRDRVIAMST